MYVHNKNLYIKQTELSAFLNKILNLPTYISCRRFLVRSLYSQTRDNDVRLAVDVFCNIFIENIVI